SGKGSVRSLVIVEVLEGLDMGGDFGDLRGPCLRGTRIATRRCNIRPPLSLGDRGARTCGKT
ncbi:MAG: hypothetical protein ACREDJ_10475, partial [Methylocella sp.]